MKPSRANGVSVAMVNKGGMKDRKPSLPVIALGKGETVRMSGMALTYAFKSCTEKASSRVANVACGWYTWIVLLLGPPVSNTTASVSNITLGSEGNTSIDVWGEL